MGTGLTNPYFQSTRGNSADQKLEDDLTVECVSVYGLDCMYIPRVLNQVDPILGEDAQSTYENAYQIAVYIENVYGFEGDKSFLSNIGLEVRDEVVFSIPMTTFSQNIGVYTSQPRPNEGDIIFFALDSRCFQIKFVDKYANFYSRGNLQSWKVTTELFEYSSEVFSTGVPEIDRLNQLSQDGLVNAVRDENDEVLLDELGEAVVTSTVTVAGDDSNAITTAANAVIDWSSRDPFSDGFLTGNT